MRLVYQNKKLYCSFTGDEFDRMERGKPLLLDHGYIKVLHNDVVDISTSAWRDDVEKIAELESKKNKGKK
jgi:hypothetical protein|tara:strand:+ start:433 stop:642 length:210 start_codon:yes stop_codon:yes gene_type:complete